jgi:hypothetical protein
MKSMNPPCRLLSLPSELLEGILMHLLTVPDEIPLTAEKHCFHIGDPVPHNYSNLKIFAVCRTLYNEGSRIFYGRNVFAIDSAGSDWQRPYRRIRPRQMRYMQHVVFRVLSYPKPAICGLVLELLARHAVTLRSLFILLDSTVQGATFTIDIVRVFAPALDQLLRVVRVGTVHFVSHNIELPAFRKNFGKRIRRHLIENSPSAEGLTRHQLSPPPGLYFSASSKTVFYHTGGGISIKPLKIPLPSNSSSEWNDSEYFRRENYNVEELEVNLKTFRVVGPDDLKHLCFDDNVLARLGFTWPCSSDCYREYAEYPSTIAVPRVFYEWWRRYDEPLKHGGGSEDRERALDYGVLDPISEDCWNFIELADFSSEENEWIRVAFTRWMFYFTARMKGQRKITDYFPCL